MLGPLGCALKIDLEKQPPAERRCDGKAPAAQSPSPATTKSPCLFFVWGGRGGKWICHF